MAVAGNSPRKVSFKAKSICTVTPTCARRYRIVTYSRCCVLPFFGVAAGAHAARTGDNPASVKLPFAMQKMEGGV